MLMRLFETDPTATEPWRRTFGFVAVVWLAIGVYEVAQVEFIRAFVRTSGAAPVLVQAHTRLLRHLLLLPLVLFATHVLVAQARRRVRWPRIALGALGFAILVGASERLTLALVGSFFGEFGPDHPMHADFLAWLVGSLPLWVVLGAQHAVSFLIAMLLLFARFQVMRLLEVQRDRSAVLESDLRARLAALQNELSPHFMFNSLHHAVARTKDPATRTMLVDLAELLRYVLRGRSQPYATVQEEIEFSKGYLALCEELGERVATSWVTAPDAQDALLPRMILHMMIENAYRHAGELQGRGRIETRVRVVGDELEIVTINDFLPGTSTAGTGVGLENIRDRLGILFGARHRLEAGAEETGRWRTRVILPLARNA